jgi:ribosomal protein S18 acetylase RimI-like enzyme
MITLRPLRQEEVPRIKSWPQYPEEFAELDYCLRDGGWLDEYGTKPRSTILAAMEDGEMAGFSILANDGRGSAELRLALHPARIGNGVGRTVLRRTLEYCFADMTMKIVRLIVRKTNIRAQNLYLSEKFSTTGECTEIVLGEPVLFITMEIDRRTFFTRN